VLPQVIVRSVPNVYFELDQMREVRKEVEIVPGVFADGKALKNENSKTRRCAKRFP
jgi:hypothetical protein